MLEEENEKDEKLVVTDITGEIIAPGNVIAYSRSGRNTKSLYLEIVSSVVVKKTNGVYSGRISFFSKRNITERVDKLNHSCSLCSQNPPHSYYNTTNCPYRYEYVIRGTDIVCDAGYTMITENQIQDHIITIKNPCFSVHNSNIAELLGVADLAKDAGYFHKEYNLGDSADAEQIEKIKKEIKKKHEAEERKKKAEEKKKNKEPKKK